jgi:hypothetical protein
VILPFVLLTNLLLDSADLVAAVDPADPARELRLGPPRRIPGTGETLRVLQVVLDPHRRDEQVRAIRDRLAFLRVPNWGKIIVSRSHEATNRPNP